MASSLIADLIDRTQRLVDRVDPSFRTRVLSAIDEACQWYAREVPWDSLRRIENFQTDGTEFLVLPDRINRIITIGDKTNSRPVLPGGNFGSRFPGPYLQKTAGALCEWRPMGTVPVISQPDGDTLNLDTTVSEAMVVSIRGLVSDTTASGTSLEKYEAQESLTLNGATQATTNSYLEIFSIQKDKDTLADLTVSRTTGGKQLARLPRWATRPLYQRIQLALSPPAGTNLEIEYYKRPDRVTAETDSLDPGVIEEAIMWRAAGNLHWTDNEGQAANLAWQKATEVIVKAKNQEETHGDKDHTVDMWQTYLGLEDLNGDDYY